MPFTPYTQITKSPEYQPPIPFDIYQRGVEKTAATNQANYENIQNNLSGIFKDVNPISQADAEILRQKEQEVEAQLGKFSLNNLNSPQAISQLKGYLSKVSNDPDVLAVHERAYAVQREAKAKKDAEEKGLPYYSRALEDASKYINDGVYIRDKRFNNSGFVGVNLAKERNAALKDVPKEKYLGKDGFYHERYNQGALDESLNSFYQDPRVKKQMLYDIEDKYQNTDWQTEGLQKLSAYKENAISLQQQALQLGRDDLYEQFQNDIDTYDAMAQDPEGYGEQIKSTVYNKELQDRIALDKAHSNFNSTEKLGEYQQAALELNKIKQEHIYRLDEIQAREDAKKYSSEGEDSPVALAQQVDDMFNTAKKGGNVNKDGLIVLRSSDIPQKLKEILKIKARVPTSYNNSGTPNSYADADINIDAIIIDPKDPSKIKIQGYKPVDENGDEGTTENAEARGVAKYINISDIKSKITGGIKWKEEALRQWSPGENHKSVKVNPSKPYKFGDKTYTHTQIEEAAKASGKSVEQYVQDHSITQ